MKKTVKAIRRIPWLMTMEETKVSPIGLFESASILIEDGLIAWVGTDKDCPKPSGDGIELDGSGLVAMPGLIDCHTHLVFGGDRVEDFYDRARGTSYAQIMARGGGIQHTVSLTRSASSKELIEKALYVLERMLSRGVTTVEVKSGYGLNLDDEIKMLEVVAELNKMQPVRLLPTFLGAHAVPSEFNGQPDDYIDFLIGTVLPHVAQRRLATAVDVFVEKGAFESGQAFRLLRRASELGFKLKVHADQLSPSGGARLASQIGAMSASHLEYASDDDLRALAAADVCAEILPVSETYLGLSKVADLRRMIELGVKVAIATDFNPGSSMCDDLHLALRLGVTQRKLTVEEAMLGVTHNAASALREGDVGQLAKGKRADICLFEGRSPWTLAYDWTRNPVTHVIKDGVLVHGT